MATFTLSSVLALISQNRNNTTALRTILAPPWVDDVGFRGTSGLVVSCVGTLLACVYTALHLNVLRKSGLLSVVKAKTKWVAIALMAPELVLYMAAQQFIEARELVKELNSYKRKYLRASNDEDFTLGYAFFVIMGGLQVDHGHFLRVSLATIEDKSKSDTVQKVLVVGQLGWMIAQCITRTAFGLPLCLLEIHTAVHAVCAMLLYAFWFKKPLDVNDPEVSRADGLEYIISFMIQEQFYELQNMQLMVYPTWTAETARLYPKALSTQVRDPSKFTYQILSDGQVAAVEFLDGGWGNMTLRPGQALRNGIGFIKRENHDEHHDPNPATNTSQSEKLRKSSTATGSDASGSASARSSTQADPDHDTLPIDFTDQQRWTWMTDFLTSRHGRTPTHPYLYHPYPGPRHPESHYHDAFTAQPGNLVSSSSSSPGGRDMWDMLCYIQSHPLLLALLLVLPALYGGIHLCGWDFEFPSVAERACWRAACLFIVGAFPALLGFAHVCAAVDVWVLRRGVAGLDWAARVRNAAWYGVLGMYACARVFIVVEAFASLRRVPIGVFWVPAWLDMVPHL
ncbi:hypothetical protein F4810DRAFT_149801 [Camillea tinctor]|nr:hypothetical protein F4810DRAFT_149801 [Camillea tinctor]